ncbi:CapA family protein [Geobacillus sp. E263]|uniref:CapA family protein n=1 Tax=Geobacillus sp. E263 TaxID=391290 RepID=UPI00155E6E46|nr:CapA family protein [Geobacillus sp. E263]
MKIGFFSDTIIDSDISISKELEKIILSNDINILNLEAPFKEEGFPKLKKGINVYHGTDNVDFLIKYKFKYVNLANNHIFDFMDKGYYKTINILRENNIGYFGVGENLENALRPIILEDKGKKIGIFGFCCRYTGAVNAKKNKMGTAPIDFRIIRKTLQQYEHLDYKIAYFHFGVEFEDYPEPYYKHQIEKLVADGYLNVVIGNHTHSIQGYKMIGNGVIFYSLGNFIFPQRSYDGIVLRHPKISFLGYFVNIELNEKLTFNLTPYYLSDDGKKVMPLKEDDISNFNNRLEKLNNYLHLNDSTYFKFYLAQRKRKYMPVMVKNEMINKVIFFIFKFIERQAVVLTKKLKIHKFIKKILFSRVE